MRKYLLLLFLTTLSFFSLGQDFLLKKIDFNVSQVPIKVAIDKLSDQTGIDIAYSANFFKNVDPVTVQVEQETIQQVLTKILLQTTIEFETLGENRVLLFKGKRVYTVVSGYVIDSESGERIVGARVLSKEYEVGAITNEYGFFSFRIPANKTTLITRSIGFKTSQELFISLAENVNVLLNRADDLPEVIVDGRDRTEEIEYSAIAIDDDNITEVSAHLVQASPSLNGQTDYVRVAQLLPGVQGQANGFGGMNIRGGESGQNLMLMDGSPVYIPYHLLGLYSTYNEETVKSMKIVKGNFPSRYGGAVSSILDVKIREGDLYHWKGSANVSLLNAGMTLEGPIKKGKGSFLLAGRYSPKAYFFEPVIRRLYFGSRADVLETFFYDYNVKANYTVSKKDRLYFSLFSGADEVFQSALTVENEFLQTFSVFDLEWKNLVSSFRWNHQFSKTLFVNTTLTYSKYKHRFSSQDEFLFQDPVSQSDELFVIDNRSTNVDYGAKVDFDWAFAKKQRLYFGLQHNYRDFSPSFYFLTQTDWNINDDPFGESIFNFNSYIESTSFPTYLIHESAIYVEDHIKLARWYFNIGIRGSGFFHENSEFINLEPRFISKFSINENIAASLVLNRRMQYLHLIANQSIQMPNDLWLPSSKDIMPQELYEAELALQYSATAHLKMNLSAYYRQINNVYSYPASFEFLLTTDDYSDYDYLEKGTAESKGIELFVDYANNKRGLLFTYALSKTERQFDSINLGIPFAADFDSRHQIKFSFHQKLSKSFKIAVNWIYNSPRPQINVLQFASQDAFTNIDEDPPGYKNTTRTKAYNRIDLNVQYNYNGEKVQHALKFGVYNLLNSRNIAFNELYSLPILPSFSYRISF
ncbi:MAG: TonB-dependent receptor plug domain-containing protein [Crocinitomix sp.]|nr:TonB-dependent receptor plug domain-containing protein [Crocinitomix sp.]